MARNHNKTRRQFLRDTGMVAASATVGACFPDVGGKWSEELAQCEPRQSLPPAVSPNVVAAYDAGSVTLDGTSGRPMVQAGPVAQMVADVLHDLTSNTAAPWQGIFPDYTDQTRIGIKVNCLNQGCATSVEVVRAVVDGLKADLGIDSQRLLVWDRRLDELTRCGFTEQSTGATVIGTYNAYNDTSGPGYEEEVCGIVGAQTSRLSRILTQETDYTINIPVLKRHGISGVTAAMKNMYGVIHNPEDYHKNHNEALPAIYNLGPIRERVRLTVLDALRTVAIGGTSSPMDTIGSRIAVAQDAVALDAFAVALVNQLRAEKNLGLTDVDPTKLAWLGKAQDLKLGSQNFNLTTVAQP